jgi:urease accessory protein
VVDRKSKNFLTALQLADSFFPSGMYAHSHGLEGMVSRGLVTSAGQVAEFLENQFTWSIIPSDGVALLEAYRATACGDLSRVVEIDQLLLAMKLPAELRAASTQFGRRVLAETESWVTGKVREEYGQQVAQGLSPGNGSVALGVTGNALGLGWEETLMVFCHSHTVSVLGAAVRLLPLTHTDAQAILRNLNPLLERLAHDFLGHAWHDMTAFNPELDLVSMGHETDELRLFAS